MFFRVLVLILVAFIALAGTSQGQKADVVVRNAKVLTTNPKQPQATAFAVSQGKFLAVGSDKEMQAFIGKQTKVMDVGGKTIVPGFTDAHAHPIPIYPEDSLWGSVNLGPPKTKTIDELIAVLQQKAKKTPKGLWIKGYNYHDTVMGRHPTRFDLDKVSTDHPILISHSSGHLRVCNSYALNMANVTSATKNPPGGEFDRNDKGELTGLLKESPASSIVSKAGPEMPEPPRADVIAGYRACFQDFFSRGITSVHVAGASPRQADVLAAACDDQTPMHLYIMLREDYLEEAIDRRDKMGKQGRVRYSGIKFFHGNSLSGQTCWLYKAYAHRPDYYGIPPARSQEKLNQLVLKIHQAGLQACIHSNGDREIDMVLDAYENALKLHPRPDHRHRIEHCSVVNEKILNRIKKLGLVIAPHSYVHEHGDKMEAYGAERWNWMHANRSMIELGIPVAGNSDYPVSVAHPLLRIQSMVTRKCVNNKKVYGENQRTSFDQALFVWTQGGAFAAFEEKYRGSIEGGKQADFVVLEEDPARVDPDAIGAIAVDMTFCEGKLVYRRPIGR